MNTYIAFVEGIFVVMYFKFLKHKTTYLMLQTFAEMLPKYPTLTKKYILFEKSELIIRINAVYLVIIHNRE